MVKLTNNNKASEHKSTQRNKQKINTKKQTNHIHKQTNKLNTYTNKQV